MASTDENDSLRRLFEADQYPAGKDHPSEPPNAPDTEQLPDQVIADRWENAAAALETARNAWLAVSPSAGPSPNSCTPHGGTPPSTATSPQASLAPMPGAWPTPNTNGPNPATSCTTPTPTPTPTRTEKARCQLGWCFP